MTGPRMTAQLVLVLRQASTAGREWYGREMTAVTGLPEGTVYPILTRLEQAGLTTGRWETPGERAAATRPRRRYYRLTDAGARIAAEAAAAAGQGIDRTAPAPWPEQAVPVV